MSIQGLDHSRRHSRQIHSASILLWLSPIVALCAPLEPERADPVPLTFEQHVRPILKKACFHCHGEHDVRKGGLDLRLVRLMQAGGRSGPSLAEGGSAASVLWKRISEDEMPKGEKKLTADEKATIRQWIDQGALTARPEPEDAADARFTLEELGHWAFQPVAVVEVPRIDDRCVCGPIDAFVLQRLRNEGLAFSELADRRTLIRRASFDVTGLPPTPEDLADFVEDESPEAWERAVDRLLASAAFGVRFGRHWLDVAGFAESDGSPSEKDPKRPHAWRYRDWTIASFNRDLPIDRFYRHQVAGDEILRASLGEAAAAELTLDPEDPEQLDLLTATGFLRMAPDSTQTSNTLTTRNEATAASIDVISTSLLGLTLGCAQCHDHKYDPISIDDYYSFRAIFDPVFALDNWQTPSARLVDLTPAEVQAERDRIEREAQKLDEEWSARRLAEGVRIREEKLADVPAAIREEVRAAVDTPADKRDERQRELLESWPMVKPASFIAGFLVEYDNALFRKFEAEKAKITALRATKPAPRLVMATTERPGVVPRSTVFFRGNPESPADDVSPAVLTALRPSGQSVDLPSVAQPGRTTGRRLAWARHLTNGDHPLAARVFVNRVWQGLLGRGLVATPGDFGISGARPSHPELLDWLARDFVEGGWSLKRLCRQVLLSTTYRQSSRRHPELDAIDPDNELLARANLRRLEAESLRDAILAVTGELHLALGGPSTPVNENSEGKAVLDSGQAGAQRRSVFVEVQRRLPLDMLSTFDQPVMAPSCNLRRHSTVAQQALWFLNDEVLLSWSEAFARRSIAHSAQESVRLNDLFLRLFGAPARPGELDSCRSFLNAQREIFRADTDANWQKKIREHPDELEVRSLASLCQVLFASNRFLYVD